MLYIRACHVWSAALESCITIRNAGPAGGCSVPCHAPAISCACSTRAEAMAHTISQNITFFIVISSQGVSATRAIYVLDRLSVPSRRLGNHCRPVQDDCQRVFTCDRLSTSVDKKTLPIGGHRVHLAGTQGIRCKQWHRVSSVELACLIDRHGHHRSVWRQVEQLLA